MWKAKGKAEAKTSQLFHSLDTSVCVICANALVLVALGSCNHYQVCADCSHRLRFLYNDFRCCVCKQTLDKVVVMQLSQLVSLFPSAQGKVVKKPWIEQLDFTSLFMERRTNMFFQEEVVADKFRNLLKPTCSVCFEIVSSVKALHTHVQVQHGGRLCNICMFYRKAYFVEQIVYDTKKSLDTHIRESHPCCLFCRKNLYDDDQLFEHLTQRHETCPICERNGRLYEYYRDYHSLEQHFQEEHFPCSKENCRGLVFSTQFELELHMQREHTQTNHSSRRARTVTIQPSSLYASHSNRRVQGDRPTREERERQRRQFHGSRIFFAGEGSTVISSVQPSGSNPIENLNMRQEVNDAMENLNIDPTSTTTTTTTTTFSRMRPCNTFIVPKSPNNEEEYDRRNEALLNTLQEILTTDSSYSEFIHISKRLRAREIEPMEYISKAVDILGLLHARRILPELISLLGDKQLQKELEQAAYHHVLLASRQLITENQQVIHHQRTPDMERNVSEFPSLKDMPNQTSNNVNHNYASGKWKQLSQVVTSSRPLQNFEASYPPLSEDENVSKSIGRGVWNNSFHNAACSNNSEEEDSPKRLLNKEKEESDNFPALSHPTMNNNNASSSHSVALSKKSPNKSNMRLRGTNLPRIGMNGFLWESKRKKKIIQAAKNALKETS